MAAKIHYPKQDRLKYIRRETPEVCTECDNGDQCEESTHRKKVVERWICEICSKEHISKAGVIRHMQEEHERKPKTHTKRAKKHVGKKAAEFEDLLAKIKAQLQSKD